MKKHCTTLAAALATSFIALATVPLEWKTTPRNPAPAAFDRHHGETLDFRCTFLGFGELPFAQAADIRLWYQTNGMAAAWWSVPASVSSNVLSATFPPQADPGADRLALFFGAPSVAYASAVLRLRHSPGFAPNVLPPPEQATFEETDPVFAAWLATNDMIRVESDPTVPAWAKSETPPQTMTTNDVCAIVTNEIEAGEWTFTKRGTIYGDEGPITEFHIYAIDDGNVYWWHTHENGEGYMARQYEDNIVEFEDDGCVMERTPGRNALGLARLSDLPGLTNGLASLSDLPPLTNSIPDAAARAVYDVHDLMWDETENILYWHKIRQGHDEYIAVTNIDLTNPVNAAALKAWREANR